MSTMPPTMRRAQVTVGVLAALVFGAAIVAAGAMQSAGTTTAAARQANFAEAVAKTMQIKNGRFSQDVTFAGRAVTITGTFDFQHNAVEFHDGTRVVRSVNGRLYVSGLPLTLPAGVTWVQLTGAYGFGLHILRDAKDLKVAGSPRISGVDLTEYSATADGQTLKVWVDSSHHIRQLMTPDAFLKLSAFGKAGPITAPPPAQVVDAATVPGGPRAVSRAIFG